MAERGSAVSVIRRDEHLRLSRSSMPEWSGCLSRMDHINGSLLCPATGWRLAVAGIAGGRHLVNLTAQFDGPVSVDDAFPGALEGDLAKPHEAQLPGYVSLWTGCVQTENGKAWVGEISDCYGGRLKIVGKSQGADWISLRAAVLV